MNVQLKDITVTARDGRVSHLDQVYIRGSHVRFFIVPDMLRLVAESLEEECQIGGTGLGIRWARSRSHANCCAQQERTNVQKQRREGQRCGFGQRKGHGQQGSRKRARSTTVKEVSGV